MSKKKRLAALSMSGLVSKRRLIITGVIVVILLACGVLAYLFLQPTDTGVDSNNDNSSEVSGGSIAPSLSRLVTDTIAEASQAAYAANSSTSSGSGVAAGAAVYKKAVSRATDPKDKSDLLIKQAEFYSENDDNKSAIPLVLEAQTIYKKTLETTSMLALLYEVTGDNKNAAIYYREAAKYVVEEAGDVDRKVYNPESEADYYLDKASQLEASN